MLLYKDIAKIREIKILFQDSWTQPEFFSKHLELFKFSKTSKLFLSVKESGVPFWEVMKILLVLPFIDIKNVGSLFNSPVGLKSKGQKDVYYRSLSNHCRVAGVISYEYWSYRIIMERVGVRSVRMPFFFFCCGKFRHFATGTVSPLWRRQFIGFHRRMWRKFYSL